MAHAAHGATHADMEICSTGSTRWGSNTPETRHVRGPWRGWRVAARFGIAIGIAIGDECVVVSSTCLGTHLVSTLHLQYESEMSPYILHVRPVYY